MKALVALVAVALVAVNGEELVTDNIKKQFVDAHNKYRGLVKDPFPKEMPAVVWDDYIAFKAQTYADNCVQSHSSSSYRQYNDDDLIEPGFTYMGENLFMASYLPTPDKAIYKFYEEYVHYDYNTKSSKDGWVVGHYTQVAWAKTKRIGCGIAHCPNGNFEYYVVCEYYPGGNYNNEYPYVSSTENCTTCAAMGYQCGEYKDSCGNNVTCNSCKTNERCENHMCVCYPKTQCEENDCGVVSDGCNGTITCGKCKYSGQECNAKGKCVCVNRKTCYKFGKNCGWMDDGCGGSYWCNSTSYGCSSDFTCRDNVCTCKNGTTCADLGYECGVTENGCGKNITCGFCTGRRTCVNHTCVLTYVGPDDPDEPGSSGSMAPGLCASVAALVLALVATLL